MVEFYLRGHITEHYYLDSYMVIEMSSSLTRLQHHDAVLEHRLLLLDELT